MAPNRKQLQHVELPSISSPTATGGLEGLRSAVQSKFLPLTDSRSQEQLSKLDAESKAQQQLQQKQQEDASYWDWNTEDDVADIFDRKIQEEEEEEEVVDLFSASHIEANLIADAKKYSLLMMKKRKNDDEPENDHDHQCRHHVSVANSSSEGILRKPQHEMTSSQSSPSYYWDWSINTSEYEEELAERLTSSTHVMKNLVNTPYQKKQNIEDQQQNDDDDHHYWTWHTETLDDEPSCQQQVRMDNYWTWNATNVPSTLDYYYVANDGGVDEKKRMAESDNYWEWTTSSELDKVCDEPWVDSMTTAQAVVSSGKSYWDW